jgi:hypothetical protein
LVTFKVVVLGTGMFFAIKWHYDKGRNGKTSDKRALLRMVGITAAGFAVLIIGIVVFTLFLSRKLGLDLTWS